MDIQNNLQSIKENVEVSAKKAGRDPTNIIIEAVVKTVPNEKIFEVLALGIKVIGENRIQEAESRYREIRQKYPDIKIHFIGHLQKNKINQALDMFDVIESVDSYELAEAIDKRAKKPIEIFIEINTSGEESKFGVKPENAQKLINQVSNMKNLRLTGLMTVGAISDDSRIIRDCFLKLRDIRDHSGYSGLKLSMGMSHDFPLAIECGSDIIRVGTSIFGRR